MQFIDSKKEAKSNIPDTEWGKWEREEGKKDENVNENLIYLRRKIVFDFISIFLFLFFEVLVASSISSSSSNGGGSRPVFGLI